MNKRLLSFLLAVLMVFGVCSVGLAAPRSAGGVCTMGVSGRTVTYTGESDSEQIEDFISVTITLWEQRGSVWYEVDSASKSATNSDYIYTSDHFTVDGGHYYRVTATHYVRTNGVSYSSTSTTAARWIP